MVYCHSSCLDSLKLYAALWNSSGEFCTHRNSRLGKTGYHGTLKRAMRQNSESTRTGAANRASRAATTVSVPPPSADPAVDVGVGGPAILGRQLALRPDTLAILLATSLLGGSWVLWEKFFKKNATKKSGDGEGVFSQVLLEVSRMSSFPMPLNRLGF